MPQFDDDMRLGPVVLPAAEPSGAANPSPMARGVGPLGRVFVYDIVPVALLANGLATSQNPASGGAFTLTPGAGVSSVTRPDGSTELVLDVPRRVTITAAGANTATYKVTGRDVYGQLMTQDLAAPSTSTVTTTKAFSSIISVTNRNSTAGTNGLTVGFNDGFGLPYRVTEAGYVVSVKWAGALAQDAGTFVAADTTSPASVSTGDVRGVYTPSSAANGSRRLVMTIALPAAAAGPQATRVAAAGVDQA